ncbi:ferritin-like domain-containing protein [Micromonospora maris]|uniref:ferritin-like domain-containing protein n=1 Tax=Micromonospora maris TaxID=1003110 RepID=UPI002E0D8AAF|nr:ferritin-like domain-containing protein [Micromonospora maris]
MTAPTGTEDPLAAALTAEYAAIWAYGPIGVRLADAERKAAVEAEDAHRSRRDALILELSTGGVAVPPDRPGYALPFPVTDRASALRLAVEVEERTAAFWRAVLPASTGAERDRALSALIEYAVRATRWRRAAGITPLTVAFPGRPG